MISFFRKIRRVLLTENKFSRYLVYAAGEIVLVFAGILIALQVNNSNEIRKKEKTAIEILKQIQADLTTSFENADMVLNFYCVQDSLAYLVLNEKVSATDYLRNPEFVALASYSENFIIKDYGFKKLDQYLEYMPKGTELLKKNLYYLYTDVKSDVEISNNLITDELLSHVRKLNESKSWIWKLYSSDSLNSEALDYYLTDSLYKNFVAMYSSIANDNLCVYTKEFRTKAIQIYKEISEAIKSENSGDAKLFPFYLDIDKYKDWTGIYKSNDNGENLTMEITIDDGTLFGQSSNDRKREIFPLSDTKFYFDGGYAFFSIILDENKNIAGIQQIDWIKSRYYKKIE